MTDLFNITTTENLTIVTINSALDMNASEQFLDVMKQANDSELNVEIDATHVEGMSTACCQILLSASQAIHEKGLSFKIVKSSNSFDVAINQLGLRNLLVKAE